MQKSDFFCIFLSGRAASFPSQAPLGTKKGGYSPNPCLYALHSTLYTLECSTPLYSISKPRESISWASWVVKMEAPVRFKCILLKKQAESWQIGS